MGNGIYLEVLVVCPAAHRAQISHHIQSGASSSGYPSLSIAFTTYEPSDTNGTCVALLAAKARITRDFVLLPCDFVPPSDLTLQTILDAFRVDVAVDGAIATGCWFAPNRPDKGAVPDEWGSLHPPSTVVWDQASGSLLHVDTEEDMERNGDELELRMALFHKFPRTRLSTALQDSHVYVCRRAVLDALALKPHFESFNKEFIPWLCKLQYQNTKQKKYGYGMHRFISAASGEHTFIMLLQCSSRTVTTRPKRSHSDTRRSPWPPVIKPPNGMPNRMEIHRALLRHLSWPHRRHLLPLTVMMRRK